MTRKFGAGAPTGLPSSVSQLYGEIYNLCGCGDAWKGFVNSGPGASGPLSPTSQYFYWSENVTF
jgi:hypothetical protein